MISSLFRWRSLKAGVTFLTLGILVLSIWMLAFFTSRMLQSDMQQQLGEQQFSTATLAAQGVNEELKARINALEKYAQGRIVPSMLGDAAALQERLEGSPAILSMFNGGIFATGVDGVAIASVSATARRTGTNYMDRDFIVAALREGRSSIGKPVMSKHMQSPVLAIATPIRDAQNKVIGALAGVTDLAQSNFLDKITQSRYGKSGGYLLIAPQHNLFVTATDKSRVMQPLPAPGINAMHDRYMQGYEGFGVGTSSRGESELSAAKGIPAAGWFVVATLPTGEAFAPIDAMTRRILLSTLVFSLVAGALTWWLITRMLQQRFAPMLNASRTLSVLADARQPIQTLPVTSQDEIGELIGGFNRLLETLRTREQALQLNQLMLARTERIAHVGSWEWHVATDTVKWSDELFRIFQRDPADGAPSLAEHGPLYVPEDMQRLQDAADAAVKQGVPYELELRAIRKDGTTRVCLARGQAERDADGTVVILFGSLQDITERKQAEAELEQHRHHLEALVQERTAALSIAKEAAEAASRAKTAFLATMSHELRTPMNGIMGMTSLALHRASDPMQAEQLAKVTRSSQDLLAIINDILDYSKMESERFVLDDVEFNLGSVMDALLGLKTPLANDKGLKLEVSLAPELSCLMLRGDAQRLGQVLGHLTSNAIQFTEEGAVSVRARVSDETPADVLLRFEVQDTGIGISAENQRLLFTAFQQVDGSTTRKHGGIGLGLALSKRLVQAMGGGMGVESVEHSGTTFWFTARLAKA
jgi:signal transduction histidine kinase